MLVLSSYPIAVLAEMAGVHVPHFINLENMIAIYACAIIGLTITTDYTRSRWSGRDLKAHLPARFPVSATLAPRPMAKARAKAECAS